MIKLKQILFENPDTVVYKGYTYNYKDGSNCSAFMVYQDLSDGQKQIFGYSDIKHEFFGTGTDILGDIKSFVDRPDDPASKHVRDDIMRFYDGNSGGGHNGLIAILDGLGRYGDYSEVKGRIFQFPVQYPEREIGLINNKRVIVTFWDRQEALHKHKHFWEYAIKFNGFDPSKVLYETNFSPYGKLMDESQFYGPSKQSDDGFFNTDKVADTAASQEVEMPTKSELEVMIDEKTKEFVEKRGKMHAAGAALSTGDMARLENEVNDLEAELEWLKVADKLGRSLNINFSKDSIYVVNGLKRAVQAAFDRREKDKKHRFDLNAEMEKQFPGMSMAQIRQKFSKAGIPFRKLVKEIIREMRKNQN